MLETTLIVGIGLIGGMAVGLQVPIAGAMSTRLGGASSSVVVHLGGLIASLLLLFLRGGENIQAWRHVPWYMLGSGALGLLLYLTLSQTVPRLGATSAITLVVVGQLLIGMVIDHFGLFDTTLKTVDLQRLAAAGLLLAGAYLMLR